MPINCPSPYSLAQTLVLSGANPPPSHYREGPDDENRPSEIAWSRRAPWTFFATGHASSSNVGCPNPGSCNKWMGRGSVQMSSKHAVRLLQRVEVHGTIQSSNMWYVTTRTECKQPRRTPWRWESTQCRSQHRQWPCTVNGTELSSLQSAARVY